MGENNRGWKERDLIASFHDIDRLITVNMLHLQH